MAQKAESKQREEPTLDERAGLYLSRETAQQDSEAAALSAALVWDPGQDMPSDKRKPLNVVQAMCKLRLLAALPLAMALRGYAGCRGQLATVNNISQIGKPLATPAGRPALWCRYGASGTSQGGVRGAEIVSIHFPRSLIIEVGRPFLRQQRRSLSWA
ncbi:hypothetical protein ZWY2020_060048 [Hordeum vulgare]|nr:hypothetical protein ZWY2020_060048 [Hordeum vulgare]